MKHLILTILVLSSLSIFGQTEYTIDNFSDKYYAKFIIEKDVENNNKNFIKGTVIIFSKLSKKKIISVPSYYEPDIISQDFDFDGIKDLAVMDRGSSCYGGPTYQIFLEKKNQLIHSPEFTRLAQEYCGMFQIDPETKTIKTSTKSGYCWHEFSTFKIINDIPKPILIVVEDVKDFPFFTKTVIKWDGDKKSETIKKIIDFNSDAVNEVLVFNLNKNGKKVVVFNIYNETLYYALIKTDNSVEFYFPIGWRNKKQNFIINDSKNELTFANKEATYRIYEKRENGTIKAVGIIININGKNYDLKGNLNSIKGTLKNVNKMKLDNVINE